MRYAIFSKSRCPLLHISDIGYANSPRVTRFGPGRRNAYLVHYILSGKGFFNGHPLSAGEGFLITPGMPEEYHPDPADPWEYVWIISDDPKFQDLLECYHADPETNIFRYDFLHALQEMKEVLISNPNTLYDPYEMLEFFLGIFKHHTKHPIVENTKPNSEVYLEAAVHYIHSNLFYPITVSEITAFLGVSQPYLFRIFKEKFSKSPKQYISDCKFTHAKKLLKETDMTVTQIAISVGFPDVLSFSKFFSAKEGRSPQSYRSSP